MNYVLISENLNIVKRYIFFQHNPILFVDHSRGKNLIFSLMIFLGVLINYNLHRKILFPNTH